MRRLGDIRWSLRRLFGIKLGLFEQHPPVSVDLNIEDEANATAERLPLISIVTPSLNQGRFISSTIESVLQQNYDSLEYIIQDSKSTDETYSILRAISDRRCTVVVEKDTGQANGINRGFSRSRGEIMSYLNSDDLLFPGTLLRVGRFFRDNPSVDVIYGNRVVIDADGKQIGKWVLPKHDIKLLKWVDYIPQETLFWRRSLWEAVGSQVDESFAFALDWELLLRFCMADANFRFLPEVFGGFRFHSEQKTSVTFGSIGRSEMERVRKIYAKGFIKRALLRLRHVVFLLNHIILCRKTR